MSMTKKKPWLRIGELAAQADLNPKTIRYYEKIGLQPVPNAARPGTGSMTLLSASS